MRRLARLGFNAWMRFLEDDGWAIASHIALSGLTSLFPFLIFVTALAGYFGLRTLADESARLIFDAWPAQVAGPIATEIHSVLTETRSGVLTVGAALALYFSSSAVEAVRTALNRAYQMRDERPWYVLRLEAIGFVLIGAATLIVFAILIIFAPLLWDEILKLAPGFRPLSRYFTLGRFAVTAVILTGALVVAHKYLGAGRRSLREIAPGVVLTLLLWVAFGEGFGLYIREFARNYVSTYAGLASVMITIVFLYTLSAIFIYGGELNAAIIQRRAEKLQRMRGETAPPQDSLSESDAAA
jgi:membrane protein